MRNDSHYLGAYDIFRAVLCMIVFASHSLSFINYSQLGLLAKVIQCFSGSSAVTSFFVLSGLCTVLFSTDAEAVPIAVLRKKIRKLYPEYLLTFLIALLLGLVAVPQILGGELPALKHVWMFIIHLLLLQTFVPNTNVIQSYTSTSWYLSCLLVVYALSPYVIKYFKKFENSRIRRNIYIYICAIIFAFVAGRRSIELIYMTFPVRMAEFSVGICTGMLIKERRSVNHLKCKQILSVIGLLLSYVLQRILPLGVLQFVLFPAFPTAIALYYLSFLEPIRLPKRGKLCLKALGKIGNYSYELFLLHYVIQELGHTLCAGYESGIFNLILLVLEFVATYILAVFVREAVSRLRNIMKRRIEYA